MPTVIEHDHTDSGASSGIAVIVGIVAIVVIGALALYFFRMMPFASDDSSGIDINMQGNIPTSNPSSY